MDMDNPEIDIDGAQFWRDENGLYHRDDGPAVIWAEGDCSWYNHGFHHREDGPAYIGPDGSVQWCLNGRGYPFNLWLKKVDISDEDAVMLKLKYG